FKIICFSVYATINTQTFDVLTSVIDDDNDELLVPPAFSPPIATNKENITLIWFDPSIDSNDDTDETKKQLREINDFVIFYTNQEDCMKYIVSIKDERIFLVTSGRLVDNILSSTHSLPQLNSTFVFCMKPEKYKHLEQKYFKIIGAFDRQTEMCTAIKENVNQVEKKMEIFSRSTSIKSYERPVKGVS
ncbi:unnamed protein product, partial [Didymodactylos carnosus]